MESKYSFRPEWYDERVKDPASFYMDPFQIFGNLYFVGNKDSSCHILDTGDGLILFDTSYPNMIGQLMHAIWKIGFDPKDIKYILHTHGHFDHFGSTKFLTQITNAKTVLGKSDAIMMRENSRFTLDYYYQGVPTQFFDVDIEIEDGDTIELGCSKITAVHTPGHSEGAMTYLFDVTDGKTIHSAVLCGGTGFNSLNCVFMAETGLNWRPDFERSLEKWKSISADIFLGNHSTQSHVERKREEMLRLGTNPFIDRNEWPAYVKELEERYQAMIAEEG